MMAHSFFTYYSIARISHLIFFTHSKYFPPAVVFLDVIRQTRGKGIQGKQSRFAANRAKVQRFIPVQRLYV